MEGIGDIYNIRITEEAVHDILDIINGDNVKSVSAEISDRGEQRDLLSVYYTTNDDGLIRTIHVPLNKG